MLLFLAALGSQTIHAQGTFDLETGIVTSGYNDIRIPNSTGTLFSLVDDFQSDAKYFVRFRLGYRFGSRHNLVLLIAPFTLKTEGQINRDIHFNGKDFPAQTPLEATYTFNSYRLTYRYDLKRSSKWVIGVGFTAKIRDAVTALSGGGISSEKTNVGFVPLINFLINWKFDDSWSLLLEGDALAAPGGQGRAEDILLALVYDLNDTVSLKAGYRLLEGGADVEEVYTFAWINYFLVGMTVSF
jgi:hypothetical protein